MSNINWGRLGITLAGYIIGGLIGGSFGAILGGVIGGIVGSLIFPDDPTRIQGTRLQNFVQTSEYGWPIPILFGHDRMGGCVIWQGPRHEHMTEEEEGGKGGGGGVVYEKYYYTQSFAVKICRGPVVKLFRIWADNKIIYDCKEENDGPISGLVLGGEPFAFYPGTEDQEPDPTIESYKGIGNVPAYRGDCYIVFNELNITDYGGRIPNLNFEVATASEDAYPEVEVSLTDVLNGASAMRMGHSGEYAMLYKNGKFCTVDILSNRVLAAKDFEQDCFGFGRIDGEGNIYTMMQDGQFIYHPICIDQGLNIVREGNEIDNRSFFDLATAPEHIYCYIAGFAPAGLFGQDYEVRLLNKQTLEELWCWSNIVSKDWGTGKRICGICIDTNYNCWALIEYADQYWEDGSTWLIKLTPFSDIKQWYAITPTGSNVHPTVIGYDRDTGYILMTNSYTGGHSTVWVWDPCDHMLVKQFGPAAQDGHNYHAHIDDLKNIANGFLWCGRDETQYVAINLSTLEVVRAYDKSNWGPFFYSEQILYDPVCNALWPAPVTEGSDKIFYKLPLDRASREAVLLGSDIVQAICEEVGLSASDLDLTEIATDEIRGYSINQQMTARQALEPLQQAFSFDWVEADGKIAAVKRGGASVVTITEDDLATYEEGQERPDELPIAHTQPLELPRVLNISYIDIDQSYQAGTQRSIRQTTAAVGEHTITLPLVLTATEAKRIAEILHYIAYLEANSYAPIYLPPKYLYLTVTDVVTVERGGNIYLLHLQKIDLGANYLMKCEAIPEDAALYNSYAVGDGGTPPDEDIDHPGVTEFYALDTPYLRDNEHYTSPYGFYVAGCGRLDAWRGAQLFRSLDGGVSYQVIQVMLNGAVIGIASNALGEPGDPWTWDYNTVTIRLLNEEAELASCSKLNALNGQNAFLLGHPNKGWELCAFAEATLNEDGSYTLGQLLRALRGTEWMCGEHSAGDIFILLSTIAIYRIADQASDLNKERLYKAVSLGMPFSSATLRALTNTGRGLMPYAPCHIRGERDGSNNLDITWVRRARIDGEWRDGVETPLDESAEEYAVDIIKDGSVVRTFVNLTSPECTYTAAQQTTDGFTPGDPIPVEVFQMSATVGRGFGGERTI